MKLMLTDVTEAPQRPMRRRRKGRNAVICLTLWKARLLVPMVVLHETGSVGWEDDCARTLVSDGL